MKIKYAAGVLSCILLCTTIQAAPPVSAAPAAQIPSSGSTINLNTADARILSKSVKGIGIKRAEAIIKYREAHQGFKSVAELSQVPGLGGGFVSAHAEEIQRIFVLK